MLSTRALRSLPRPLPRCSAPSLEIPLRLRQLALRRYAMHSLKALPLVTSSPARCRRRALSTPAPQVNESHISMDHYHALADQAMDDILATMEEAVEAHGDESHEVDYHSGVLTLNLGASRTYVINKQPPNKQIWLSSPISGPKRYDFHEETASWVYSRDNSTLHELLSEELSSIFGEPITFSIG